MEKDEWRKRFDATDAEPSPTRRGGKGSATAEIVASQFEHAIVSSADGQSSKGQAAEALQSALADHRQIARERRNQDKRALKRKCAGKSVRPVPATSSTPNRCQHQPQGAPLRCPYPSCPNSPNGIYRVKVLMDNGTKTLVRLKRVQRVVETAELLEPTGIEKRKTTVWGWEPA